MQINTHICVSKDKNMQTILVTGGAGFIGSHTVVELLEEGYTAVVYDDLSNSSVKALERVKQIVGPGAAKRLHFVEASILDRDALQKTFDTFPIDTIIHFAGFKAVGESVEKPLEYYWNNIAGTLILLDVARAHDVRSIVFSSSATVYGQPEAVPVTEETPKLPPTNPYGQTKSMLEQILSDMHVSDERWNVVLLRYFNPIGAHISGLIGEDPAGIPNNLVPYVAKVAIGALPTVGVFGNDYPTPDGTGVRDYIHVVDLARGHVAALKWMDGRQGVEIFNLGTGVGSSVLDVINAYSRAVGRELPYEIKPRRAGDIAENYADCTKAREVLGWQAQYDIERMCEDSWRWQSQNPNGYRD
jgi:UDP-glucose 4-epimerase